MDGKILNFAEILSLNLGLFNFSMIFQASFETSFEEFLNF